MVRQPEEQLQCFVQAGAEKIVFHLEAASSPAAHRGADQAPGGKGGAGGQPGDAADQLPLAGRLRGQRPLPDRAPRLLRSQVPARGPGQGRRAARRKPNLEIGVDGGIKESNVADVARLGVDYICVGSAIAHAARPRRGLPAPSVAGRRSFLLRKSLGWRRFLPAHASGFHCDGLRLDLAADRQPNGTVEKHEEIRRQGSTGHRRSGGHRANHGAGLRRGRGQGRHRRHQCRRRGRDRQDDPRRRAGKLSSSRPTSG